MNRLSVFLAVTLAGNVSVGDQLCPGSNAKFECQTTEGSLMWMTTADENYLYDEPGSPEKMLGIFLVRLDGILA